MRIRTSFRGKLLLLAVIPLIIAQLVTLFAAMRTVEQDVHARARDSLRIGASVVNEYLSSRADQLRTSVEVLAADFGLKGAVSTGDPDSIRSVLLNHSQRIGADVAITLDLDGRATASTHSASLVELPDLGIAPGNQTNVSAYQFATIIDDYVIGDGVYQTFAVPLRAPVPIGWVVLGFRLDDAVINRLESLTGQQIVLASSSGRQMLPQPSVVGHSISTAPEQVVASPLIDEEVRLIAGDDSDFLAIAAPLTANARGAASVKFLLLRSMNDAMAPYVSARRLLVSFSVVLLVAVMLVAAWLSSSIAKPLHTLNSAARRMMAGKYDESIEVDSDDEVEELATSFNAMRTAIAEREQRISHQALHDPLTDLPNRRNILLQLQQKLDVARQQGSKVYLLLIRLSRIDAMSSTLGHSASDELLVLSAEHLRLNLADKQILGHVGTSEFVLVLPDSDSEEALSSAEQARMILDSGVTLGRVSIAMRTEIGIAGFPLHGGDAASLLRNASIARSEARLRGESISIFECGRDEHYVRQLTIVNDLRGALSRGEVQVWYQPQVALADGRPSGAEALVRWKHPEFGWLSPDEFVPAAEEAGTVVHLTRYVLRHAIAQCRHWQDKGFELQVSVNISARDLADDYLSYYVLQLLQEQDMRPSRLTLEVTESSVMLDLQQAVTVLKTLRDAGVRIAMDDFGTGQSSLAQLQNIPLHELKIDKSFVMTLTEDARNEAIVRTTLELAHNLKLSVVAEGVENEETLCYLSRAGCEHAQGYFLSKPAVAGELLHWLKHHKAVRCEERRADIRPFGKRA